VRSSYNAHVRSFYNAHLRLHLRYLGGFWHSSGLVWHSGCLYCLAPEPRR